MAKKQEEKDEKPRASKPEPPTIDKIKDLKKRLEGELGGLRSADKKRRESFEQTYEVATINPDVQGFEPSRVYNAIQSQAVKQFKGFLRENAIYSVSPGRGPEAEKRAERAEGWLNNVFSEIEEQQGAFEEDKLEDACRFGRGYEEIAPDPKRWGKDAEGYPDRLPGQSAADYKKDIEEWKRTIQPVMVTHLPADEVLPVFGRGFNVLAYIHETKMSLAEVVQRWGDDLPELKEHADKQDANPAEQVTILRYGDSNYLAYAVLHSTGDRLIHDPPFEHGMGMCPLVCFPGETTSSRDLARRFKAVFEDTDSIARTIDELRSRQASAIRLYPYAQPVVQLDKADYQEGKPDDYVLNPRKPIVLWMNEHFGYELPRGEHVEAESLEEKLERHIETNLLPTMASGSMEAASGSPAWSIKLVSDLMVRTKLQPLAQNLALGGKQAARRILAAIQSPHFEDDERFYVRPPGEEGSKDIWITKAEAKECLSRVRCRLSVRGPVDTNQDMALAIKAWQEFRLPWRYCAEEIAGIENPAELREERLIEDAIEGSPEYLKYLTEQAMKQADLFGGADEKASPEEVMGAWPNLSPTAQQAITETGMQPPEQAPPGVAGIQGGGWPQGAGPESLRAPVTTTIPGASPMAPGPGEAMP
jgi:hypothetical protein